MLDYEKAFREFNWASMDKEFDWYNGGVYNVAHESLDRHAQNWRKNKIALYSINADNGVKKFTFGEMSKLTSQLASGLSKLGASKGDRIFVYLDRTSELYISMLGVIKLGGIAGPLFSALGPEAVRDRALDCGARFMITSPYLYQRISPVLNELNDLKNIIMVGGAKGIDAHDKEIVGFDDVLKNGDPGYEAANMAPTDPYIMHYTSGSTGKPKGVIHGHRAMVQQTMTCAMCSTSGRTIHIGARPTLAGSLELRMVSMVHGTSVHPSCHMRAGSTPKMVQHPAGPRHHCLVHSTDRAAGC